MNYSTFIKFINPNCYEKEKQINKYNIEEDVIRNRSYSFLGINEFNNRYNKYYKLKIVENHFEDSVKK